MTAFEEGTHIIEALCAAYATHPHVDDVQRLMIALHSIARVIDDAVDIGLVEDRIRMLKSLPFIWEIAGEFQKLFPEKQDKITNLIHEWCTGNNPQTDTIENIGHKNRHLLLIEELLHDGIHNHLLEKALVPLQLIDETDIFEMSEWYPLLTDHKALIKALKDNGFTAFSSLIQHNATILERLAHVE